MQGMVDLDVLTRFLANTRLCRDGIMLVDCWVNSLTKMKLCRYGLFK